VRAGLLKHRPRQARSALCRQLGVLPDVHGQVGRHLVVAGASGVELSAHGAGDLRDPALDRHVDVLVVLREQKRAVRQLAPDLLQRPVKCIPILARNDPLAGEHRGVRS
jgi:hypothetical protein